MKYYGRFSQEEIEAEQFEEGNIDNFIRFLSYECSSLVIHDAKFAVIKFPFGHTKELIVSKGDYVIKGYEIPGTIPKSLHEFHVMPSFDFENNYILSQS